MSFRFANKLILAKEESTYATDPTPVEGSNAMLTKNLTVSPYEGERVSRGLDKGSLGNDVSFNVGAYVMVEFDVEIAGSSNVETAPEYGPLLTACGLQETITPTTGPIEYEPESLASGMDSITIYFNADGEQQIIVGCRGNMNLSMAKGQMPFMHFRFLGIYARPTAVSQYSPTIDNWVTPQPVNKQNTLTRAFDGYATILESFDMDLGNQVSYRNLPGLEAVEITNRGVTWNAVVEAPTLAQKDFYALVEAHTAISQLAIQIAHGSAATNRFTVDLAQAQIENLNHQDSDSVRMYSLSGVAPPSAAGNDDCKLTVTGPA